MLLYKKRIVVTGGTGRFANIIKKNIKKHKYDFFFPKKKELNILKSETIRKYI